MRILRRVEITGLQNDGRPILDLNLLQFEERERYLRRKKEGIYSERILENCPLCAAEVCFLIAEKDRYALPVSTVVCQTCGLIYTMNPLDKASLLKFYKEQYRSLYEGFHISDEERKKRIGDLFRTRNMEAGLAKVLPEIRAFDGKSLVIEIGAGGGWNLAAFQKRGIPVLGADFDPELVHYGNERGIRLLQGSVEELLQQSDHADLIILNHVLEHVSNPGEFLSQCRLLLKPGGLLFIGVPGLHALRVGEWGSDLPHTLQNAHLFLFDWFTLKSFAARAGLLPVVGYPLIWSVFRAQEPPDGNVLPASESRGEKVLDFLRTLRITGPLWHNSTRWLGGAETKQALFLRRMAAAVARRTWAGYSAQH